MKTMFIIPDGESLARQFLYGNKFTHSELGVNVRVGWAVDSSGHCPQLPQILRLSGIDSFYFWRGMPYDGPSEFVWKGLDGSRVNAIWLSKGFDSAAWLSENTREAFSRLLHIVEETGEKACSNNVFLPVGGELVPPLPHLNDVVTQWNSTFPDMRITIVTPGEFSDKLKGVQTNLPFISGSLDSGRFSGIRSGGLSARPKLKIMNRRLETLLYLCEIYLSLANDSSQSTELENLWRNMLFNQDHNIIRGTIADEPYKLAKRLFEQAIDQAEQLFEKSVNKISQRIPHQSDSNSFVVYNPLSWIRTDVVKTLVDRNWFENEFFEIRDSDGNSVPYQIVSEPEANPMEIILSVRDIPSLGYRVYRIIGTDKSPEFESSLKSGKNWIESDYFTIELDEFNGSVQRLYDKRNNNELLRGSANFLHMENDVGDIYRFSAPQFGADSVALSSLRYSAKLKLIESGPVRSVIQITSDLDGSSKAERIIVYDEIPRIDFELQLNLKVREKRIRLNYPLTILSDTVQVGSQFGTESKIAINTRSPDWNEQSSNLVSALDWIDCAGPEYGLCFSSPGLHEYEFTDGVLRTTLLRSVEYLSRGFDDDIIETRTTKESGLHEFRYMLHPHIGNWQKAETWKVSAEHRISLIAYPLEGETTTSGLKEANLQIEGVDLMLSCYKPEGDDAFIIRLFEPKGDSGTSQINFHREVERVTIVDLLEREIGEVHVSGSKVEIPVDSYSIITLQVIFKSNS